MLKEALTNETQTFDATAAFCLDTLDAAHLAQNRIAGIAARQKVPPSKSDTTATSTAKQSDNCSMQNDNNNAASRVCGVAEASKAQNNISADAVPPGSAAATAGQGDRAVAPGGQAAAARRGGHASHAVAPGGAAATAGQGDEPTWKKKLNFPQDSDNEDDESHFSFAEAAILREEERVAAEAAKKEEMAAQRGGHVSHAAQKVSSDSQETHAKTTPIKTAKSPENTSMQDGKQSDSTKWKATPYDKLANSCRKRSRMDTNQGSPIASK